LHMAPDVMSSEFANYVTAYGFMLTGLYPAAYHKPLMHQTPSLSVEVGVANETRVFLS